MSFSLAPARLSSLNVYAAPVVNGTYTKLTTVTTNATGAFSFEDINAGSFSARFYKFSY